MNTLKPTVIKLSILGGIISLFTILVLGAINFFDISYPVTVVNTTKSTEFSMVGEGKVDVRPDTAYVSAGITVNDGATVNDVQKKMTDVNNKIIDSLTKLGIKKEDIKTSNYSVYPNYKQEGSVSGYNGNVSVDIKVKNIDTTSQVIDAVTKAGANQINGVNFTVDNPDKYREEARNQAIANAKAQAEKLSSSLGIRLGKITNIVESSSGMPPIMYDKMGLGGAMRPELVPVIEPGSQTITSVVTLYYEKK